MGDNAAGPDPGRTHLQGIVFAAARDRGDGG